jgi:hypothetical protein
MRHKTTSKNFSGIFFYIFCDIKDQILKFLLFFTFLSCFEIFHLFALKGKSYHSGGGGVKLVSCTVFHSKKLPFMGKMHKTLIFGTSIMHSILKLQIFSV